MLSVGNFGRPRHRLSVLQSQLVSLGAVAGRIHSCGLLCTDPGHSDDATSGCRERDVLPSRFCGNRSLFTVCTDELKGMEC